VQKWLARVYDLEMRLLIPSMLFIAALCAQPPQEAQKKGPPRPYQNLKVLKVEPGQIGPIMRTYTAGLGVGCDFCHVQGNFAADEKPTKDIARRMISMTEAANATFPDGKAHVACYTCHRGEKEPPMNAPAGAAPAAAPKQ
jgi:hypothetical protein